MSGETHLFLGKQYRLVVTSESAPAVRIDGDRIVLSVRENSDFMHRRTVLRHRYRIQSHRVFPTRVDATAPPFLRLGIAKPRLIIRSMSQRWGSFTAKGNLVLNTELAQASRRPSAWRCRPLPVGTTYRPQRFLAIRRRLRRRLNRSLSPTSREVISRACSIHERGRSSGELDLVLYCRQGEIRLVATRHHEATGGSARAFHADATIEEARTLRPSEIGANCTCSP